MPVDTRAVPGTGLINFDGDVIIEGFAVQGRHAMDAAIAFEGPNDAVKLISAWFGGHFSSQLAHYLPLQHPGWLDDRKIPLRLCVHQGFNVVRITLGLKPSSVRWCSCAPIGDRAAALVAESRARLRLGD
jgi:hypothetical protein